MEDYYKNYKFIVKEDVGKNTLNAYHMIKVYSPKVRSTKLLQSINGGGNFSLYLQDRFFSFEIDNETKRISSFNGELTFYKIKKKDLFLPATIKDGILKLDTNADLPQGTGQYVKFDTNNIFYDKKHKILQIGSIDAEDITYKYFNNAYVQIKNGELIGLLFTEIEF